MHIVTGVINKEPYFKPNPMGSDMYGVELYEVNTDKGGNKVYTNYKAFIYAKSDGQKAYFKQNIHKGAFIVIQSDTLMPDIYMPQHGDQPRVTMLMQGAKVKAVNGGQAGGQQQQNHQPQQQGGWGQPQQPQQQSGWGQPRQPQQQQPRQPQPQQQYSEPPMNFDDENPMG